MKLNGKVGSYASASIDFDAWFKNEQLSTPVTKSKKTKNTKEPIYPVFEECAKNVTDIFWIKNFNIWAGGKLPKFFSYKDHTLYYNKSQNCAQCELTYDPAANTILCMNFFKMYGGIYSMQDGNDNDDPDDSDDNEKSKGPIVWSTLSKKNQDFMIRQYVLGIKPVFNLNPKETNKLLQTIRLCVSDKTFNKSNIIIENATIIQINGLMWNPDNRIFRATYDTDKHKKLKSKSDDIFVNSLPKDMIPQFNLKYSKYLEIYDKKNAKYQ